MDWKEFGQSILTHAPEIGAALGSVIPGAGTIVGGTAGAGIKAIAGLFGLSEQSKPEDIQAAIQADPQAVLKLKLANMDFVIRQRELDIAELKETNSIYIEELRAKTIPWVDAAHKLGRQILNYLNIAAVVLLLMTGHAITPEAAAILGVPNVMYQYIKGKGNQPNGR